MSNSKGTPTPRGRKRVSPRPPRKPKSRDERKEETRERLLRVATRVFTKRGFDATSIADVCREARVTHGALYHHFPSKTELFAAIVERVFGVVAKNVEDAVARTTGPNQVEAACEAYWTSCSDPVVQAIVFRDGPRVLPPGEFAALDEKTNAPLVFGLFEDWIARGWLRPMPIEVVARVLGAAFAEAGAILTETDRPDEVRPQLAALFRDFLSTLRTPRT